MINAAETLGISEKEEKVVKILEKVNSMPT